jgi:hypothetical protein
MMNSSVNGFACPCCRNEMVKKPVEEWAEAESDYEDWENSGQHIPISRQETTTGNEETVELEEGEIVTTEFEDFVYAQRHQELLFNIPYVYGSLRMFTQRLEEEEPEQEQDIEVEERKIREECEEYERKMLDCCIRKLTNKGITMEDMVKTILHSSFGGTVYDEAYYKVYGYLSASIKNIEQHYNRDIIYRVFHRN